MSIAHLSDQEVIGELRGLVGAERPSGPELLAGLRGLVHEERRLLAKILEFLGEVDCRGIYREESSPSMYDYCVRKLLFSEDQACRRIAVARVARAFPQVLAAIAAGRIHLSSVERLRPFLTSANVDDLINRASGMTRSGIDLLVATLAPKADVPESISVVPEQGGLVTLATTAPAAAAAPAIASLAVAPAQIRPLSETRYSVTLTVSAAAYEKVGELRRLMRLTSSDHHLEIIFERALELLHENLDKKVRATTKRPRRARRSADPGYVTAATRREVHERDGSQCTFVSADGERCPAREFLELEHTQPRALGGAGDATNITLLCRSHNRLAAEKIFGREHVESRIRSRQARSHGKMVCATEPCASTEAGASDLPMDAGAPARDLLPQGATDETRQGHTSRDEARQPDGVALATEVSEDEPMQDEDTQDEPMGDEAMQDAPLHEHTAHPRGRGKDDRAELSVADGKPSPREVVRSGLLGMGFPSKQTDSVLARMPATTWTRPFAAIFREAIGLLTPPARTAST